MGDPWRLVFGRDVGYVAVRAGWRRRRFQRRRQGKHRAISPEVFKNGLVNHQVDVLAEVMRPSRHLGIHGVDQALRLYGRRVPCVIAIEAEKRSTFR
jgi:hypothetical protein